MYIINNLFFSASFKPRIQILKKELAKLSFKIYFVDYAIIVLPFYSPLYSLLPCIPPPTIIPSSKFVSMCHTYKFFGFSISHTILNLSLSILYLPSMLLVPCSFYPILSLPPPR